MKLRYLLLSFLLLITLCVPMAGCQKHTPIPNRYDIFLSYDEEQALVEGTATITTTNGTSTEWQNIKFHLYGNAYREGATYPSVAPTHRKKAYYLGDSWGDMTVLSVEGCSSWLVGGEDEDILIVNLTAPCYPDEKVTVTIRYTLRLARVNDRTGIGEDVVTLGNAYPILCRRTGEGFDESPYYAVGDPFVSECANYRVTVDFPENYLVATSGVLQEEHRLEGRTKAVYTTPYARHFALCLSTKFKVESVQADGVQIFYYFTHDQSPQTVLTVASEAIGYFQTAFGKLVTPQVCLVEASLTQSGMEYSSLFMLNKELSSDDKLYTTVHELAHLWWYDGVGSDQINEAWQDEGLAEYSCLLFFENVPHYSFTKSGLLNTATRSFKSYFTVYEQLFGTVDTSLSRSLSSFDGEYDYVNVTYHKSVLLFEALYQAIGEAKFFDGLKRYYKTNLHRIASPEDLCADFQKSGIDVEGLFASFCHGTAIIG